MGGIYRLAPCEAVFSVKVVLFILKTELPAGEWQGFVVRPWLCAGSCPTWQVQMAWGRGTGKWGCLGRSGGLLEEASVGSPPKGSCHIGRLF